MELCFNKALGSRSQEEPVRCGDSRSQAGAWEFHFEALPLVRCSELELCLTKKAFPSRALRTKTNIYFLTPGS